MQNSCLWKTKKNAVVFSKGQPSFSGFGQATTNCLRGASVLPGVYASPRSPMPAMSPVVTTPRMVEVRRGRDRETRFGPPGPS